MKRILPVLVLATVFASFSSPATAGDAKSNITETPLPVRMSFVPASPATPTLFMTVAPTLLNISALQNGLLPPAMFFSISVDASSTLNWSLSDNATWLDETPVSGASSFQSVQVQVNQTNLSPALYTGTITVSSPDAINSPVMVTVNYSITCCVRKGDVNHDGTVNVVDLTYFVARLFQGGPAPPCLVEADVSVGGSINVVDLTVLVAYLFQGGPIGSCP